jgi:two-component system sensor histidine kinase KdpD
MSVLSDQLLSNQPSAPMPNAASQPAGNRGHRVLLGINSASDSEHLILWTKKLAADLVAPWLVLYVETPSEARFEEDSRLNPILDLARELGAEVVTTVDEDFVDAVLRVAVSHNTTQIIVGKEAAAPWWQMLSRSRTMSRLLQKSETMGVHIAPIRGGKSAHPPRRRPAKSNWGQYLITTGTIGGVALAAGAIFTPLVGAHATALLFLLATVILALYVDRGPAALAATLSALSWDYFFLPPVYAFQISHLDDALLLIMYFVVALILGQLTVRIRTQEAVEREREARATTLYLLTRELAQAATIDQIIAKVVEELGRSFEAAVAVLLPGPDGHLISHPANSLALDDNDRATATWTFERRQPAGKHTANLPGARTFFIPLESVSGVIGVLGLRLAQSVPPTIHQHNLLDADSRQIALALDKLRLSAFSEQAKILAESERLSKTLLDSVSHEIRTPLSGIKTAVSSLGDLKDASPPVRELVAEIQEASERLNRVVGKALDITRLDSGYTKPLINECEVNDIVNVAVAETEKELARHRLTVEIAPNLPIIRVDFVFLQQALMNLLSNAAFHTPPSTAICLRVWMEDITLFISVADRGPGLDPQSIGRVFDKFYRGPNAPTGGAGLGLSLVKGFVEALGGKVAATNREGGGAEFIIFLPAPTSYSRDTVAI